MTTKTQCRRGHEVVIEGQAVCLECGASTLTVSTRLAAPFRAVWDRMPLLPPRDELQPMVVACLNIVAAVAVVVAVPEMPWWAWALAGLLVLNSVERVGFQGTYYAAMFLLFVVAPLIFIPWVALSVAFGWY